MKNISKAIFILSFFFLMASPTIVVGQQTATQGAGANLKKTTGQEVKEGLEDKIATIQARLSLRKKEIIKNYFQAMTKRLEAAINRLNKLITRIESRITKIETTNEDINTKPIKKEVQKAKDKIQLTTDKLNESKIKIDDLLESNTPKEGFMAVKDIIKEIKQDLIEIHQILVKVIGDIKGLRVGNSATPSAETE